MIDKTRRKIDIALDEYKKGNISLEDYINVVKENKENAISPKEEAEEKHYKKEVKRTVREEYRASKEIIGNYTEDEIYEVIEDYLKNALIEMELNTDIIDFQIVGSRNKGTYKEGSDIDVLVEYNNSELREDNLFNLLNDNEEGLVIEGITVDFNPINVERSGYTIDSWLEENYEYDKYNSQEEDEEEM